MEFAVLSYFDNEYECINCNSTWNSEEFRDINNGYCPNCGLYWEQGEEVYD